MGEFLLEARDLNWEAPRSPYRLSVPRFLLRPGDRIAVTGPSGAGKSTLLGLLSLALRPARVEKLAVSGQDAVSLWQKNETSALSALRCRTMGFVPQTAALLPFLSARENIALPLEIRGKRFVPPRELTLDLITERLGITACLDRKPETLSVGQRQRVAVARALAPGLPLLLADEPTAALHPQQAGAVLDLLTELPGPEAAVVIVTHDSESARRAGFETVEARLDGDTTWIETRPEEESEAKAENEAAERETR